MVMKLPDVELATIAPELIVCGTALLMLIFGFMSKKERGNDVAFLGILGIIAAIWVSFTMWGLKERGFSDMIIVDHFSLFFKIIFLVAAGLTILMSLQYLEDEGIEHYEYYVLLLFSTLGMMIMASGEDLVVIFLGLETMSIAIYILAGFRRENVKSNESALKYLLLGAFSSAFLLYGIALIYGATGSTNLHKIAGVFQGLPFLSHSKMLLMGMGLLIVGFGFKVASVPFHMWTPDVYEGAPTPVTGFMAVGVKAAAFAAFLRVFFYALPALQDSWTVILWVLAVATMTLGNLVAIAQENIKRMLAYSSIAHAGYILVAMVAGNELGQTSIIYYLLAYTIMNLGAFAVVILYGRKGEENVAIEDYRGMGLRHPILGAAMTIFMFSLAGIPPTAGFVGKFYVFSAAIQAGYIWLAIIGILNSAVSVYYYFRVTIKMYMQEPEKELPPLSFRPAMVVALVLMAVFTLKIGILPSFYLDMARQSIRFLH
ncbi:MAG: NADH-quinone oxidoreductase subunit N [Desulfatiglandales bacterium]